jgi:serine/threonine protein kinase
MQRPHRAAYSMRALGQRGLPEGIRLAGVDYWLARSVKHDFFAATGFYDDATRRRVVLKIGRTQEFAGIPLIALGKWLFRRELRFYQKLRDLDHVPKLLGTFGPTGIVVEYVDATPLSAVDRVPDGFFQELQNVLAEVHRRNLAYVDANKLQNILIGKDHRPHLIDFQISWDPDEWGGGPISRWFLTHFQSEDNYHVLKHKSRLRPDELTAQERASIHRKTWLLRAHRFVMKPYFKLRRRTFQRLRETGRLLPEGSK